MGTGDGGLLKKKKAWKQKERKENAEEIKDGRKVRLKSRYQSMNHVALEKLKARIM